MILGVVLLPPISDLLKEKFKLWQSKGLRYVTYVVLFFIAGVFIPKEMTALETTNMGSKKDTWICKQKVQYKLSYIFVNII